MGDVTGGEIASKQVESIKAASIRFLGQPQDIPSVLERLRNAAGDQASGNLILLHHWGYPGPEQDLELCLPVSQTIHHEGVENRILPGRKMLTLVHRGDYNTLAHSWQEMGRYMRENRIGWGNGSGREVYLEGPEIHGDHAEHYLTELQAPLLLPEWVETLESSVTRYSGAQRAHLILDHGKSLQYDTPAKEKALWMQGMLERLQENVLLEWQRERILASCSHIFPERRVEYLQSLFQDSGNLDAVIAYMKEDRSADGASYYGSLRREGDTIWVIKNPYDANAYQDAETKLEKKLAYCHCPMVKDALQEGVQLDPIYCYCGAGWYHTLWEEILGRKVRVEVVRSLLKCDDVCEFAIHLA